MSFALLVLIRENNLGTFVEKFTGMSIVALLSSYAVPVALLVIANAKISAAILQLHQTCKQSR